MLIIIQTCTSRFYFKLINWKHFYTNSTFTLRESESTASVSSFKQDNQIKSTSFTINIGECKTPMLLSVIPDSYDVLAYLTFFRRKRRLLFCHILSDNSIVLPAYSNVKMQSYFAKCVKVGRSGDMIEVDSGARTQLQKQENPLYG